MEYWSEICMIYWNAAMTLSDAEGRRPRGTSYTMSWKCNVASMYLGLPCSRYIYNFNNLIVRYNQTDFVKTTQDQITHLLPCQHFSSVSTRLTWLGCDVICQYQLLFQLRNQIIWQRYCYNTCVYLININVCSVSLYM